MNKPCHALLSQAPLWHSKLIQARLDEPTCAHSTDSSLSLGPFSLRPCRGWQRAGASPSPRGRSLHAGATAWRENRQPRDVLGVTVTPSCGSPGALPAGIARGGAVQLSAAFSAAPQWLSTGAALSPTHRHCSCVPINSHLLVTVQEAWRRERKGKEGGEEGQNQPCCSS